MHIERHIYILLLTCFIPLFNKYILSLNEKAQIIGENLVQKSMYVFGPHGLQIQLKFIYSSVR